MNKKLSVTEYADLRICSRQNILKSIADNRTIDGVKKYEKVGNSWVLTVSQSHYDLLSMQASKGIKAGK